MYPNIVHMDWQKHIHGSQMMDPADSKGHVFSFRSNIKSTLVVLTECAGKFWMCYHEIGSTCSCLHHEAKMVYILNIIPVKHQHYGSHWFSCNIPTLPLLGYLSWFCTPRLTLTVYSRSSSGCVCSFIVVYGLYFRPSKHTNLFGFFPFLLLLLLGSK